MSGFRWWSLKSYLTNNFSTVLIIAVFVAVAAASAILENEKVEEAQESVAVVAAADDVKVDEAQFMMNPMMMNPMMGMGGMKFLPL